MNRKTWKAFDTAYMLLRDEIQQGLDRFVRDNYCVGSCWYGVDVIDNTRSIRVLVRIGCTGGIAYDVPREFETRTITTPYNKALMIRTIRQLLSDPQYPAETKRKITEWLP